MSPAMRMKKPFVSERPWGSFEQFTLNETTTVKLLRINARQRLSYQYHRKRSEFWKVVAGKVRATIDGRKRILAEGDTVFIPRLSRHRAEGIRKSVILEIAHGRFDEKDITRLEDDYMREAPRASDMAENER